MTSVGFAYWLQGFFELSGSDTIVLTKEQIVIIKNHLNMVFKHEIDPSMGNAEHQQELNQIHVTPIPTILNAGPFVRC